MTFKAPKQLDHFSQFNVDPFKEGSLGQPSQDHHFALHPHASDPLWKQYWDCRDMFYDPHWDQKNIFVSGLKGAFLSTNLFLTYTVYKANTSGFAQKKLNNAITGSPYGILKVASQSAKPFLVGGFAVGAAWHIWYNMIWTVNSTKSKFTDQVLGTGIFASAVTAIFQHPRNFHFGFLGGCLLGFATYTLKYGNYGASRGTMGYYTEIGNKTQEERQQQAAKDYIHFLSTQFPQFRFDNYTPIQ